MEKLAKLGLMSVLIACILISGCVSTAEEDGVASTVTPSITSTAEESSATGNPEISATPIVMAELPNRAAGVQSDVGREVEFLGVKGKIVTGQLEGGKVTLEPLQINDENRALLVYGSFDHPTYGSMAMAHYPQRGDGEGEYDLYDDGELVATMKVVKGYGRNAYVTIACEPDRFPDYTEAALIKRLYLFSCTAVF